MRKTASEVAHIDRVNRDLKAGKYDEIRGGARKSEDAKMSEDASVQQLPLSPVES